MKYCARCVYPENARPAIIFDESGVCSGCRYHESRGGLPYRRGIPTGSAPLPPTDKVYSPIPIPSGEKPPADTEFENQNELDRWLFDLLSAWARNAGKRGDDRTAGSLVDRASALPGLNSNAVLNSRSAASHSKSNV